MKHIDTDAFYTKPISLWIEWGWLYSDKNIWTVRRV